MALSGVRNLTVAGALVLASTMAAAAQETITYPVDTVTLVTDSNPGGGTDVYFREMIKYLGPMLGVNFVVKNNSAGGGAAVLAEAATAPADGSVLYGVTPSYIYMSLLTDLKRIETTSSRWSTSSTTRSCSTSRPTARSPTSAT